MHRQRGLSLMSTMVGLLLAIFSVLAVMALFRTLVLNTVDAKDNAAQDTVVSSGMLTAQMEIQKAGFGIESTTSNCANSTDSTPSASVNTDLILIADATLTGATLAGTQQTISASNATGNALIWRWFDSGQSYCAGLLASGGGLLSLRPSSCTSATNWASTNWTSANLIPQGRLAGEKSFQFLEVKTATCWPFGKSASVSGVSMIMQAGNSSVGVTSSHTVCLPNICR